MHPLRAVSSGSFPPDCWYRKGWPHPTPGTTPGQWCAALPRNQRHSGSPVLSVSPQGRNSLPNTHRYQSPSSCTSRCGDHNKRYTRPCHQRTADSGNFDPPAILRADNDGTPPARYLCLPVFPLFLPYDLLLHWCKGYASIIRSTSLSGVSRIQRSWNCSTSVRR